MPVALPRNEKSPQERQQYVEKPPHLDEQSIRNISDSGLIEALGSPPGVSDIQTLRQYLGARRTGDNARNAWWPITNWSEHAGGTKQAKEATAAADALLIEQVDVTGVGLGRSVRYGFHYLRWLTPLVEAYALERDERYLIRFEELLGEWYAKRDSVKGEWLGLDVIWYSLGTWARAYLLLPALDVFGSALSDACWGQVMKTLLGGARWSAEEHDEFRNGNWQLVCASQLLHCGALYPEFVDSDHWVKVGKARILDHLELDFYADGGHHERSPSYHGMCLEAIQLAAAVGRELLAWSLADDARFHAMHEWLAAMTTPDGWTVHFQDSGIVWPAKMMLRGAYLTGKQHLLNLAKAWMEPDDFNIQVASLPSAASQQANEHWKNLLAVTRAIQLEHSHRLETSCYALMRSGPGRDDMFLAVNYGPFIGHELEPHSHRAVLDFVLTGWGVPLLWEAGGPPNYDDPHYHDWYQASRGHNTVMRDGNDISPEHEATVDGFATTPLFDVFEGHHNGYSAEHRRRLVLFHNEPRYVLIDDSFAETDHQSHSYRDLLHSTHSWQEVDRSARTFKSSEAPGVLVIPLDPNDIRDVHYETVPARQPDRSTQSSIHEPLYSLGLEQATPRIRVAVVPFQSEAETVRVDAHDDGTQLHFGHVRDIISEAGAIRLNETTERENTSDGLVSACLWSAKKIALDGLALLEATSPVSAGVSWGPDGFTGHIQTERRCTVRIFAEAPMSVAVNDVWVQSRTEGGPVTVSIPASGAWTVRGIYCD